MDSGPIILKSSDRPKKRRKEIITEGQAIKAGSLIGMTAGKIDGLRNKAVVGRYLEQLGATQIGRATILATQQTAESDLAKIDTFIQQNDGADLTLIMDLFKLKAVFEDIIIRAAQAQMKIKGETVTVQAPTALMPAFPPGTIVQAVQATIPEPKPIQEGT